MMTSEETTSKRIIRFLSRLILTLLIFGLIAGVVVFIYHKHTGESINEIIEKTKQMNEAVKVLDFETAAILRDEIKVLNTKKNKK